MNISAGVVVFGQEMIILSRKCLTFCNLLSLSENARNRRDVFILSKTARHRRGLIILSKSARNCRGVTILLKNARDHRDAIVSSKMLEIVVI